MRISDWSSDVCSSDLLGFSEVLQALPREKMLDKAAAYARNIHAAASGLQAIISDILNLSRVEAGALEVRQERCDLTELLGEIRCLLQPLAAQKDITPGHGDDRPCLACCDRRLTRQRSAARRSGKGWFGTGR